jgi:pyruvate kinase
MVSVQVVEAMRALKVRTILAPTTTGKTALKLARFKPDSWILAYSERPQTHEFLNLAYGVHPCAGVARFLSWRGPILRHLKKSGLARTGDRLILMEGADPSLLGGTASFQVIVYGVKKPQLDPASPVAASHPPHGHSH